VLAFCWLGLAGFVWATIGQFPERVATHFGWSGEPNGWMNRDAHATFVIGMGVGLSLFVLGLFSIIRALGGKGLNVPNRSYWLEPERREATLNFMTTWGSWLACWFVVFTAALHWLIWQANTRTPAAMSGTHLGWITGGFVAGLFFWITALFFRFGRKK
jgi:serine/threonine-protein kinase